MESLLNSISESLASPAVSGWKNAVFDLSATIPNPEPLVYIGGAMVMSRENLCVITGRAKVGKSTLLSCLIASCLKGSEVMNISAPEPLKVLWCDTEQAPFHLSAQCNRALRLACGVMDGLTVLALRPFSPSERYGYIKDAVAELNPDIIFIDGVSDLVSDVNNLEESEALVADLLTLSSERKSGICAVIHTIPTLGKLRGHLGSTLERKCETSILLERSGLGESITVRPKESRNKPFEKFSFCIGDDGDPMIQQTEEKPITALDWLMVEMEPGKDYLNKELINKVQEHGFSKSTITEAINRAVMKGYAEKVGDKYRLKGESGNI